MSGEDSGDRLTSRRNVLRGAAIAVTGTVATRAQPFPSSHDDSDETSEDRPNPYNTPWNDNYKKDDFDGWFTDPETVYSGERSFRVWTNPGNHYGMDARADLVKAYDYAPDECQEMFVQFYVDFDGTIDENPEEMKGPGFCNVEDGTGYGGIPSEGGGWSVRMPYWSNDGDTSDVRLSYYIYHIDQPGHYGEWDDITEVGTDGYHKIDQHVKMNTAHKDHAHADGELRCWVDGTKEYERTDLRFTRHPERFYPKQWMMLYHGGSEPATTYLETRFDELRIATWNFAELPV